MNLRILTSALAATTVAVVLTACGTNSSTPTVATSGHDMSNMPGANTASAKHNAADIAFAQGMIPHHQQAVEMAKLAGTRAASPQVKDLAARIEAAQTPEIVKMTGWLTGWGAPMPTESSSGGMAGMDMGDSMPGMMSETDMANLSALNGPAFDQAFLTMMITHHQGALTQAQTELATGADSDARALAQAIIDGQTKEIAEMQGLLAAK